MKQEIGATEGGRDWGAIIPSFLDDYGLDPYEMRVYIRLARRAGMGGQCWESVSKMALACQMSERKLKDCLALLRAAHLVKQIKRPGLTDVYELLPENHWLPATQLPAIRSTVTAYRTAKEQKSHQVAPQEITNQPRYEAPRSEIPRSEIPSYEIPRYTAPTTQVPGIYKGIPLTSPIKDSHEGIPHTPLTPQGHECEQDVPDVAEIEVLEPIPTSSRQERSEQLPSSQPVSSDRGHYSAAAGGACEKFEQGIKGRSHLPSYRTNCQRCPVAMQSL